MRSLPVFVSPEAREDLADIRRHYLRVAGPAVAARMIARLKDALARIGETPHAGSLWPEYGPDVRLRLCAPYIIYVAAAERRVEVLRVLHASRDRDAVMSRSGEDE